MVEQVLEKDAGVLGLHLWQPVGVGRGDRREVAGEVGVCTSVGAVHCSR